MTSALTATTARRCMTRGVSLIELVVVVMILGIATSIATPMYFHALARGRVEAAARRVIADLALVQSAAKTSSDTRTLQFSSLNNRYTAVGIPDRDRPSMDYIVPLNAAPYYCDLVSVDCGDDEQIVFDGFGLPDSAASIVVASGNLQRIIVVDGATGKGEVQ